MNQLPHGGGFNGRIGPDVILHREVRGEHQRVIHVVLGEGGVQDVTAVTAKVASYRVGADGHKGTAFLIHGSATSEIDLNPHWPEMRINTADIDYTNQCDGIAPGPDHTHTTLHETRHCYQTWLTSLDAVNEGLGYDDEWWNPYDNDEDGDWLVDEVSIAPTNFLLDTTEPRMNCFGPVSFSGDTCGEKLCGDHVDKGTGGQWGGILEMDAEAYAARFYNSLP